MWFDETKADLFHHRSKKCLVQTEELWGWGSAGTGLLVKVQSIINQSILVQNLQISFRKMKLKRNFDLSASNKSWLHQKIKVLEWSRPYSSQSVGSV